ncbi:MULTISPECIES: TetR/AcrR family transcriptional regulator [Actinomyces]|uniref:TetR family transcriptional regulator n=1 Tax=Actinomyces respiraculi TaxID=2744574 RepID=A0A7T0LJP9_9ACTO|nr:MULTISPECIES: TetR family transcriptional regulator [Actinomyces]QPL04588.1 TetR family transcriptional regulator [Actinomyces respiraculi]
MTPRGRRPAGSPDAREAILAAARTAFARDGYTTSLRGIARDAGVDPALVHHYFPDRAALFSQAVVGGVDSIDVTLDPAVIEQVRQAEPSRQGEMIIRLFLTTWDRMGRERFTAVVRAAMSDESVIAGIRDVLVGVVIAPVVAAVAPDRVELRTQLIASQVIGLGMVRWVAQMSAVRDADREALVRAVGPVVQRYLTGDLGPEA